MQRSLLVLCIAISSLTLVPAPARADALSSEPTPDPSEPSTPSMELSIGLTPTLGIAGLGGLGNGLGLGLAPSIDVGLMLDPRVALVLGGQLLAYDSDAVSGGSVWIPLLVQVYLDAPRVGAVIPTIRVGVVGRVFGLDEIAVYGGGVRLAGGITWLADRWLALRLEVGGSVDASYRELDRAVFVSGAFDARGSVVMRL